MGGLSDIIADKMKKDMVLDSFLNIVNTEWSIVFDDIKGESVAYALPEV